MTLFWNDLFQNQKCRKKMNDHYVEKANNLTFKLSLLSVNITAKFHYFNMKTGKCKNGGWEKPWIFEIWAKNRPDDVIKLRHDTMFDLDYF